MGASEAILLIVHGEYVHHKYKSKKQGVELHLMPFSAQPMHTRVPGFEYQVGLCFEWTKAWQKHDKNATKTRQRRQYTRGFQDLSPKCSLTSEKQERKAKEKMAIEQERLPGGRNEKGAAAGLTRRRQHGGERRGEVS